MSAPAAAPITVLTLGCRLNGAESERLQRRAAASLAPINETVIINTCAVTAEAVREAKQWIRREKRRNPEAEIWVTGCAADTEPATFTAMAEVTRLIPNGEKNHLFGTREVLPAVAPRARAYLPVQNGCDHRCTFCIIPYGRGASRSLPLAEAVREAAAATASGAREVVLTGVDLTSWGEDLPDKPRPGRLVREILRGVPDLPRLRLSSIDAAEIDPELEEMIAYETRLMPHLHLSLQSGSTMILKRMKRRHSREQGLELCERLRRLRPDMVLGADLIAGFPTETDEMFADTLQFIDEAGLTYVHVFPFSPREGTPAARMPQLPRPVVKERAAALRASAARRLRQHLDGKTGRREIVLVEHDDIGRCADFTPVRLQTPMPRGTLTTVDFTGCDGTHVLAVSVADAH